MSDSKVRMLAQLTLLVIGVGIFFVWIFTKTGYTPPQDVEGPERTFHVVSDGRELIDTENSFVMAIPNQWVAEEDDVPNVINLHHQRADIICDIEVAHGKNVTGTSATGFLNYYDPGGRVDQAFKDSMNRIDSIEGFDVAYLGWTIERTGIRHREVYAPYSGYLVTMRFTEDTASDRIARQPVPCIQIFNQMVADMEFPA